MTFPAQLSLAFASSQGYGQMPSRLGYGQMPMQQPVAEGSRWTGHVAPNGRTYYYNKATGKTSWEKPAELQSTKVRAHAPLLIASCVALRVL